MVKWAAVALATTMVLFGLAACGDDDDEPATPGSTATATAGQTETPTVRPTQTPQDEVLVAVAVFFARDEHIATGGRMVMAPAVARGAIEALLAGPSTLERDLGMGSEVPAGTRLLDIDIANGLATVDLSREFESGGGSLSMTTRVAQVVYTLTQYDSVDRVTIRLDGKEVEAIGGEGVPAKNLTRDDFRDNTPLILVESPAPGAEVHSPLEVLGTSNTFEATVEWLVTDWDGRIVKEGFTTATAGTGTWGTFAFEVDLAGLAPGRITLVVFESSPKDGSPTNVYEVPLTLIGP
jgi:hypothetical protein